MFTTYKLPPHFELGFILLLFRTNIKSLHSNAHLRSHHFIIEVWQAQNPGDKCTLCPYHENSTFLSVKDSELLVTEREKIKETSQTVR